ncbi:MAG: hypothetical protein K9N51_03680 [Candidatus Pacebacteria bacterium]|nr:hypothetical protein [Candidatus Paceibacterota bacterium]
MTPQAFICKWRNVKLTERSAAQQHFHTNCTATPSSADGPPAARASRSGTARATVQIPPLQKLSDRSRKRARNEAATILTTEQG